MEAGAVPRVVHPMVPTLTPRLLRLASDARLLGLVREGRQGAFETVYDRHHRGILAFCRHMLSDSDEAEDAVQHTFMAAYTDLMTSEKPIHLRAWLFTIARNRCYTILRGRREQPAADLEEAAGEGLASQVERRQDLRDLVNDMRELPEEQRAALVLAELDALSHTEVAEVLGVPREKVKALVFQARESLVASRAARDTACSEIREQLACGRGATLRRANLRRHLRECDGCRAFRAEVEIQRKQFALLLPVVPTIALKQTVLGSVGATGGAAAVGGGFIATSAIKGGLAKGLVGMLLAGAGTAGTLVVATTLPLKTIFNAVSGTGSPRTSRAHHSGARVTPAAVGSPAALSAPRVLSVHARVNSTGRSAVHLLGSGSGGSAAATNAHARNWTSGAAQATPVTVQKSNVSASPGRHHRASAVTVKVPTATGTPTLSAPHSTGTSGTSGQAPTVNGYGSGVSAGAGAPRGGGDSSTGSGSETASGGNRGTTASAAGAANGAPGTSDTSGTADPSTGSSPTTTSGSSTTVTTGPAGGERGEGGTTDTSPTTASGSTTPTTTTGTTGSTATTTTTDPSSGSDGSDSGGSGGSDTSEPGRTLTPNTAVTSPSS